MESKRQLVTVDSLAGSNCDDDDEEVVDVGWTQREPSEADGALEEPAEAQQDQGDVEPEDALDLEAAFDDERYGLDGVEPRPTAQKVVIAIVAVLVVLVALYVLDYWNVVRTGFSGLFGA